MERLTFTDLELEVNGCDCVVRNVDETFDNFCEKVCDEFQYNCPFDKLGRKLKAYEDTGLTPEQIIAMDEEYRKMAKELGEYKRLEEQGRLIKLPCKVGDTVYSVECNKIKEFIVSDFEVCMKRIYAFQGDMFIGRMGLSVFATKAEAEKALEEMEK